MHERMEVAFECLVFTACVVGVALSGTGVVIWAQDHHGRRRDSPTQPSQLFTISLGRHSRAYKVRELYVLVKEGMASSCRSGQHCTHLKLRFAGARGNSRH